MRLKLENGWIEYIPGFIDSKISRELFDHLMNNSNWNQGEIKMFGKRIAIPRLEAFYADDGLNYHYSGQKLKTNLFTTELDFLRDKIQSYCNHTFNSVLLNLYQDENDSNGWHSDNEKELGDNPLIASLSLGESRRFEFRHNLSGEKFVLELSDGDLLIMGGELQHFWKHRIPKIKSAKKARINLTFRQIIKS